jgi:hypothetical protein
MKRIMSVLIAGIFFLGLAGLSLAAVEVKSAGTVIGKTETINITGPAIASSGTDITISTLTETGDKTVTGDLTVVTGGIVPAGVASDPCGTYPAGSIFINSTTGAPCYCNKLGVDLSLYDGTTGCF